MPLVIKKIVEPLTRASEHTAALVIQSDGLHELLREMLRYARGEVVGRSYLIAGHRGVGKTTMVRQAIELLERQLSSERTKLRPLFVDLHGPDLVAAISAAAAEGGEQAPAGAPRQEVPAASKPKQAAQDWQSFAERLTFGLYRTAVEQFAQGFRQKVGAINPELAGQFEVELDRGADLRKLREFYAQGGVLDQGVLFPDEMVEGVQQGVREVTLLASAGQAYRIISGAISDKIDRTNKANRKTTVETAIANAAPPLAGLLAGSLTWGALPADAGAPVRVLSSIIAGLAGVVALKITSSRGLEQEEGETTSFVPRTDRESLRRLLPALVDRFREAGLVPIFVVDELDKVEKITDRMDQVMGHLKQFVTERAFFCFLAARDYFESIEAQVSGQAHPVAETLFGERLFVQYRVADLHAYLEQLLPESPLPDPTDQNDLELLPYVLLRRSFMHPFTLRHLLTRYTDDSGLVKIESDALFNALQYRNDVLMQAAVECVLDQEEMAEYVGDPAQAQLAYDALYYPSRVWQRGQPLDAGRGAFTGHLRERMGKEANDSTVLVPDVEFLHEAMCQVVAYLADPKLLLGAMSDGSRPWPVAVRKVVEAAEPLLMLE